MDPLATYATGITLPLLQELSLALDNLVWFSLLIVLIVFFAEKREDKRVKIILALFLATVQSVALKNIYFIERPCSNNPNCPADYSFPSIHAAVGFTLMIAFLNKKNYPLFLLFGMFTAFTRLHLGVHTLEDVAAALPVAFLSYYIADIYMVKFKVAKDEQRR